MAFVDELQKTDSVVGEAAKVISRGLDVFSQARSTFWPVEYPVPEKQTEPIAAKPFLVNFEKPAVVIVIGVIAYLLLRK